jgi:hypothetical protein
MEMAFRTNTVVGEECLAIEKWLEILGSVIVELIDRADDVTNDCPQHYCSSSVTVDAMRAMANGHNVVVFIQDDIGIHSGLEPLEFGRANSPRYPLTVTTIEIDGTCAAVVIFFMAIVVEQMQDISRNTPLLQTLCSMVGQIDVQHGKPPFRVLAMHSPAQLAHRMSQPGQICQFFERIFKPPGDDDAGLSQHQIHLVAKVFN